MGKLVQALGWLLLGTALTFLLYLPVWFAFGAIVYGPIHPDYWISATPDHIFPMAAFLAAILILLGRWILSKL